MLLPAKRSAVAVPLCVMFWFAKTSPFVVVTFAKLTLVLMMR